jgi:hypothetical protein
VTAGGGLTHPYTKALYEHAGDGLVRVTAADGRTGLFRADGRWVDGELRDADPQLCGWVGGPRVANHRIGAPPAS